MEDLKAWIIDNIMDKNGKPSGRSFSVLSKKNNENCKKLLNITKFLDKKTNVSASERVYCIINDITTVVCCKMCEVSISFTSYSYGYQDYCSPKCFSNDPELKEKRKRTCILKYGSEHFFSSKIGKEKIKNIILERHGVKNVFQSEKIKEKIRNTNIKNLGVPYPLQSKKIRNKSKATCLEKYGEEYSVKVEAIRQARKEAFNNNNYLIRAKADKTHLERYGVKCVLSLPRTRERLKEENLKKYEREHNRQAHLSLAVLEKLHDPEWLRFQHYENKKSCTQIAKELGVNKTGVLKYFRDFGIPIKQNYSSSCAENEIKSYIKQLGVNTIDNSRKIIMPYELDIYLPDKKLAIEYNGLFWHSSYDKESDKKHKNYHLMKTRMCLKKDIQLFHIFENEWADPIKKSIWKSIINNKLGKNKVVDTCKCSLLNELSLGDSNSFLSNNHLLGAIDSVINLGLYFEDMLVSIAIFNKLKENNWEMIRHCDKIHLSIVGGSEKLFNYFVRSYGPRSIIVKNDLRYSNGSLCKKLKMNYIKNSDPDYYYFSLKDRTILKKSSTCMEDFFNKDNYRKIWDCGNMVYKWKK